MPDRAAELDLMDDLDAISSLEQEFPGWRVWREGEHKWFHSCFARSYDADIGVSGEDWADLRDMIVRAKSRLAEDWPA
jgi:hypothetical protein